MSGVLAWSLIISPGVLAWSLSSVHGTQMEMCRLIMLQFGQVEKVSKPWKKIMHCSHPWLSGSSDWVLGMLIND